ncbi:MAG: hypothetical protein RLY70_1571, partial [Planctomycetota bacterium]
ARSCRGELHTEWGLANLTSPMPRKLTETRRRGEEDDVAGRGLGEPRVEGPDILDRFPPVPFNYRQVSLAQRLTCDGNSRDEDTRNQPRSGQASQFAKGLLQRSLAGKTTVMWALPWECWRGGCPFPKCL